MALIPVILCGGSGSRLWPVSREHHPKPFIRLEDGQSFLQKAFLRGAALPDVSEILTVTNREFFFKTEDEYREVNQGSLFPPVFTSFILEPCARNTAAAIASAALYISSRYDSDTLMLVLAADHLITDQAAFGRAVEQASVLALDNKLVTFGIKPEGPETGYGYIEWNRNEVVRFVEKPDHATAQKYVDSGKFLWNSGMFCFKAGVIVAEMEKYSPDIMRLAKACIEKSRAINGTTFAELALDAESFAQIPDNSIDYAVMEKSHQVNVVPCQIGWSDIGSWDALSELTEPDQNGNRLVGPTVLHEVRDCYIQSRNRMVGAVGVSNLIVVDTPDALLIADKSSSQDVKQLYTALKKRGHDTCKLHTTVHRPWGTYTVLEEGERFKIKRIVVKPGSSLSLQMHHHRSEHWVVVQGMAKVVNGETELWVRVNESTYIPAGHRHRLSNPGMIDLVMIEVQSGEYLGEDDIVRIDDVYGRTDKTKSG